MTGQSFPLEISLPAGLPRRHPPGQALPSAYKKEKHCRTPAVLPFFTAEIRKAFLYRSKSLFGAAGRPAQNVHAVPIRFCMIRKPNAARHGKALPVPAGAFPPPGPQPETSAEPSAASLSEVSVCPVSASPASIRRPAAHPTHHPIRCIRSCSNWRR